MPKIVFEHVTKRYDRFYAVDDLNLVIEDNAFVTLLGPSGCGKTTTLRMIAGLETPTSGKISIGEQVVFDSEAGINVPPNKRRVGFLFQNYALWPNMTVYKNIAFGLSNIKEEMPQVDSDAMRADALIKALETSDEIVTIIHECVDKKGKLDIEKAHVRLIDRYEISMTGAKTLMALKLQDSLEPSTVAKAKITELRAQLKSAQDKCAAQGCVFNEDFALVKDGKVLTSVRKLSQEEIDLTVRKVGRIVKIGMFMDRYPAELSGGQQQRVAIARTLAPKPSVLFMDEPLSNLDAKLRLEMRSELQRLHIETGSTFLYVTHDQMEAMTLSTSISLMDNGVLQQYDAPLTVYGMPNNLFVADFVGSPAINFINARGTQRADGGISLSLLEGTESIFVPKQPVTLPDWYWAADSQEQKKKAYEAERLQNGEIEKSNKETLFNHPISRVNGAPIIPRLESPSEEDFVVGVRPEFIHINDSGALEGEIYSAMPTGMETTVKIKMGDFLLTAVVFGGVLYQIGEKIRLDFQGDDIVLFSRKNGQLISQGSLHIQ